MTVRQIADDRLVRTLRQWGLRTFPGAHLKSPWPGHGDLAVRDKTFCYLNVEGQPFAISCKLPASHEAALALAFTKPTAYGLGRAGWVTAAFEDDAPRPPIELFQAWIEESYRAQAPKRRIAELDARGGGSIGEAGVPAPSRKRARKRSAHK